MSGICAMIVVVARANHGSLSVRVRVWAGECGCAYMRVRICVCNVMYGGVHGHREEINKNREARQSGAAPPPTSGRTTLALLR